jgi:hypothetical protein
MSVVIVIYWLASGQPAVDLMEAQQCATLMAMTKQSGGVVLELSDGNRLMASRVECYPFPEAAAASLESQELTQ